MFEKIYFKNFLLKVCTETLPEIMKNCEKIVRSLFKKSYKKYSWRL